MSPNGSITCRGARAIAIKSVSFVGLAKPVSIEAIDDQANKISGNTGTIRISRTGTTPTTPALGVKVAIGGDAEYGVLEPDDYTLTNAGFTFWGNTVMVTIPAGAESVDVILTPITDNWVGAGTDETATFTIINYIASTPYGIADNNTASITLSADHPCGDGSDAEIGDICIVINTVAAILTFEVKATGELIPYNTTADASNDILTTIQGTEGVNEAEDGILTQDMIDAADRALETATDVPLQVEMMAQLMVPGILTSGAGMEWVRFKFDLDVVGKQFTWNGSEWIESPGPFEQQIPVDAWSVQFNTLGNLNVMSLSDMRRFIDSIQGLFVTAANDLAGQNINAKDKVEENVIADKLVFPDDEDE